jgi:hypothetical protein
VTEHERHVPPPGYHHIWCDEMDPLGWYGEPDPVAHSPAALRHLIMFGQAAYQSWVADFKARERRQLRLF